MQNRNALAVLGRSGKTEKPLNTGFNEIVFGGMAVICIFIFLYVDRYRASASQRNRSNKIRWNFLARRGRRRCFER